MALKEIRLEHEEGAPCTAIREGTASWGPALLGAPGRRGLWPEPQLEPGVEGTLLKGVLLGLAPGRECACGPRDPGGSVPPQCLY